MIICTLEEFVAQCRNAETAREVKAEFARLGVALDFLGVTFPEGHVEVCRTEQIKGMAGSMTHSQLRPLMKITVGEVRKNLGSFHDDENIPDTQECIARVEGDKILWAIAFIEGDKGQINPRSKYLPGYEQEVNHVVEECRNRLGGGPGGRVESMPKKGK